ncbi:MAG TPA: hypothetical protein PKZ84_20390 [Anaerolineae bacterium]|nr:hypothetical protein [Anaerolineae bacterium]HQI86932.1 hypothetical protein [Anaerolineae bacterium]
MQDKERAGDVVFGLIQLRGEISHRLVQHIPVQLVGLVNHVVLDKARRLHKRRADHALGINDLPFTIRSAQHILVMQVAVQQVARLVARTNLAEQRRSNVHQREQPRGRLILRVGNSDSIGNPIPIIR